TTGGTAATHAASTPGTSASAATTACSAFAVTDTAAPPTSSAHGYHATRCPLRATPATVATTMIPSTINGHAHACPTAMPEREARSASAVNDSQNAPPAMNTVPPTAVPTAHRRARTPPPEAHPLAPHRPPLRRVTRSRLRTPLRGRESSGRAVGRADGRAHFPSAQPRMARGGGEHIERVRGRNI